MDSVGGGRKEGRGLIEYRPSVSSRNCHRKEAIYYLSVADWYGCMNNRVNPFAPYDEPANINLDREHDGDEEHI